MENSTHYAVITRSSLNDLIPIISKYISQGWKPSGGLLLIPNPEGAGQVFAQVIFQG